MLCQLRLPHRLVIRPHLTCQRSLGRRPLLLRSRPHLPCRRRTHRPLRFTTPHLGSRPLGFPLSAVQGLCVTWDSQTPLQNGGILIQKAGGRIKIRKPPSRNPYRPPPVSGDHLDPDFRSPVVLTPAAQVSPGPPPVAVVPANSSVTSGSGTSSAGQTGSRESTYLPAPPKLTYAHPYGH